MIKLAFYKGLLRENDHARLFDRVVATHTGGRFSHVEIVEIYNEALPSYCLSSSPRDQGVRGKWIDLNTGRWVLVDVPGDEDYAVQWFRRHLGKPYDWFGLFGWVLPWRVSTRHWWFCSEACAEAMGLDDSWHISPNDLYRWSQLAIAAQEVPA